MVLHRSSYHPGRFLPQAAMMTTERIRTEGHLKEADQRTAERQGRSSAGSLTVKSTVPVVS